MFWKGGESLEINIREEQRMVEIWLTNAEKHDPVLQEQLKPLYLEYCKKKYLVAVFQSGDQNLASKTSELLCYNRKRIAEAAVRQARRPSVAMKM